MKKLINRVSFYLSLLIYPWGNMGPRPSPRYKIKRLDILKNIVSEIKYEVNK